MAKHDSNPPIYLKEGSKYRNIGRLYDRDVLWYGNYYVYCKKYSRGMRSIESIPADPDLLKLCAALDMTEDAIINKLMDSQKHWTNISAAEVFRYIRTSVLETLEHHKKELINALK